MVEVLELSVNEHFTVNRDTDDDIYMCNFCLKVIKAPMAVRMDSFFSIWFHLKHMHPDKIKKTKI